MVGKRPHAKTCSTEMQERAASEVEMSGVRFSDHAGWRSGSPLVRGA